MKMEILAPAGSMESLVSAVRCGANAVYLGAEGFNARRNADNFDSRTLQQGIEYAHQRGVKVYLTVNTLVGDTEMQAAYDLVRQALSFGADALIVQDLGLAKMISSCFPEARLHASTQCSVHTPDGFAALKERGFVRAVLPREMSLEEIDEIRRHTDLELEMFVHGALCMCVSGQCYLSGMLGTRSGNRGLCAQPCRLAFSADNSGSFDLSLKDLSLIQHLKEIEGAGVCSLKIEGRMKRPEYVAAAVTACRKALEGNYLPADEAVLKNVFSRSGFTDGYFTGKRRDMFGTRQKEDVTAAKEVLKDLAHLYDNETPLLPVDFDFTCHAGAPIQLTATTDANTVRVTGAVPEVAVHKALTKDDAAARLQKLGGTQYYIRKMNVTLDGGLSLSASALNALRRAAVEALDKQSLPAVNALPYTPLSPRYKSGTPYYTARFAAAAQVPKTHPFRRIFLPLWEADDAFVTHGAGVELPRGMFGREAALKERLSHLKSLGVTMALCPHLGAYQTARALGFEVYGDFGLNVFNSESARQFSAPILSFELTLEQANRINAEHTGIVAYGKLPLMLTRNCPVKNRIGCAQCNKQGTLTDRKGFCFPVKCSPYPCVEILNPVPLWLGDRMSEVHTDFAHFYFTDESQSEIETIVRQYQQGAAPPVKHTRGLYFRGVK